MLTPTADQAKDRMWLREVQWAPSRQSKCLDWFKIVLWALDTLPIIPVKSKFGITGECNQSRTLSSEPSQVLQGDSKTRVWIWFPLALGWAARGGMATKEEPHALRVTQKGPSVCCTAAWGKWAHGEGPGVTSQRHLSPGRGHKHCVHRSRPGKGRWEGLGLMQGQAEGEWAWVVSHSCCLTRPCEQRPENLLWDTANTPENRSLRSVGRKDARTGIISGVSGLCHPGAREWQTAGLGTEVSIFLSRSTVQIRQWVTTPGKALSVPFTPEDSCDGLQLTATLKHFHVW